MEMEFNEQIVIALVYKLCPIVTRNLYWRGKFGKEDFLFCPVQGRFIFYSQKNHEFLGYSIHL